MRFAKVAFQTELCNGLRTRTAIRRETGFVSSGWRGGAGGAGHHAGAQQAGGQTDGRGRSEKEAGEHAAAEPSEATGALPRKERTKTNESPLGEGMFYILKPVFVSLT